MKIIFIASGIRQLRRKEIVGGGPVVAVRQANAMARLGHQVFLEDVSLKECESACGVEAWTTGDGVKATSWWIPQNRSAAAWSPFTKQIQEVDADYIFVQEYAEGEIVAALKGTGTTVVWQPNDFGFMCGRSWRLKGDGTRCEIVPVPTACARCQLHGRTIAETAVLNGIRLMNRLGLSWPIDITQREKIASSRAANLQRFVDSAHFVLAQSSAMQRAVGILGVSGKKVLAVNYGAAATNFVKSARKAGDGRVHFAYIARASFEKGLHLLLEAWSRLDPTIRSQAMLRIYSSIDSTSPGQRRRLCRLLDRCQDIEVRNEAVAHRLDEVYAEIDAAVQPSLWADHNTQTILEALARGVPAIVPRHTSFATGIVIDGVNGLLFDVSSRDELVNTLTRFTTDFSLRASITGNKQSFFSDDDWARAVIEQLSERSCKN